MRLHLINGRAIIGVSVHCIARIVKNIEVLRPTHLSCVLQFGILPENKVLKSMERFATDVMPRVRAAGTAGFERSKQHELGQRCLTFGRIT